MWGYTSAPNTRTVDTHIAKLRQKIEEHPSAPKHLITMHGMGSNFPFGYCTAGAQKLEATGSSQAQITRHSATAWTVTAPANSVGRLYEQSSSGAWSDKGLYDTSLGVQMNQQ